MAKDKLRDLHLFAMESLLPFGIGIAKNVKTGGLKNIIDVLNSEDPFSEFQVEGESSAKKVRDKIDELIPGLGHPALEVNVAVEKNNPDSENNDQDSLVSILNRIDTQLDELRHYLNHDKEK